MTLAAEAGARIEDDPLDLAAHLAATERVHLVGIGGSGSSGLARILRRRGYRVTGSDSRAGAATAALERDGIPVTIGHRAESIDFERGLVVVSAAVPDDNPEVTAARARGVPVVKYALALGASVAARRVIAIAGCHGKTTTTALAAFLLRRSGIDCGFLVGGRVPQLDGSAGEGRAREFVVEACEFDRSFLRFAPAAAAITNIDADHLDYFGSLAAVEEAFREFTERIRPDGLLIVTEDARRRLGSALASAAARRVRVRTVGTEDDASLRILPTGATSMRLRSGHEEIGEFRLRLAGEHNLRNAAMAILLALEAGADIERVRAAAAEFAGADRRMSLLASTPELTVIDDYGHHPTELRATLAAIRLAHEPRRLVLVFQPHQHSRTRLLFDDFVDALAGAERVILPEIFAARDSEEDRRAVSSRSLVEALAARGVDATYAATLAEAADAAWDGRRAGDLVLTSGAGDVDRVAHDLVRRAASR